MAFWAFKEGQCETLGGMSRLSLMRSEYTGASGALSTFERRQHKD